jgi:hypothetical protein
VLRLWPERLVAAVLPEAGALSRIGGKELARWGVDAGGPLGVQEGLDRLIGAYRPRGRASVELIVSDSAARLVPLPWQDNLRNDSQREAYARACLDQAGFQVDGEWLVHAAYRHYRDVGLGYALPRALVMAARDHLAAQGIRLRSIMPASACAYWRASGMRGKRTVLLLHERRRLSALLFDGRNCAGFHVQPAGAALPDVMQRLAGTIDTVFPAVSHVRFWSYLDDDTQHGTVKSVFPEAGFDVLSLLEGR